MKNLTKSIAFLIALIGFGSQVMQAQTKKDSVRIVNQALQMIAFEDPIFESPFIPESNPKMIADMGFEQPNTFKVTSFKMKDGISIHAQEYEYTSNKTVLLLHGTLASGYTYNKMAGLLSEALKATVITIDLRGHGQSGGTPGDISTTNQYAEDVNEVIKRIQRTRPEQSIVLAGHSMGGGIILRHTETFPETKVDGYLFFAPNLGTNAPTSTTELNLENNFVKSHLSRGLGIRMLKDMGIHDYDELKVVFYNLPEQMPIRSYSYRSMQASVPLDYKHALKSIDKPLLVLAGSKDEAFVASEYAKVVKAYTDGESFVIEDETHNGIRHNAQALEFVRKWAQQNL